MLLVMVLETQSTILIGASIITVELLLFVGKGDIMFGVRHMGHNP